MSGQVFFYCSAANPLSALGVRMSDRFPLTEEETYFAVFLAILLNIDGLPQLKGKGAAERSRRESAVHSFAGAVVKQLKGSGVELTRGPSREAHTTWVGIPKP